MRRFLTLKAVIILAVAAMLIAGAATYAGHVFFDVKLISRAP